MTETEKLIMVQTLVGDDTDATDAVVSVYLALALRTILDRIYPYDRTQTTIPSAYDVIQCELAARYFLRRGAEGETAHSENGISRTYGSVNDEDILCRLTPYMKVVG